MCQSAKPPRSSLSHQYSLNNPEAMSVDDRSDDASVKTISHVRLLKSTSAVMRRAARAVSLVALRQQAAPKCNHECFFVFCQSLLWYASGSSPTN